MAQIRIYSDIIRGFIEYTGNTVQMRTSAGAEDQCAIAPGPNSGTITAPTAWRTNGSVGFLTGLSGSSVVKAFAVWMGTPLPNTNGSSSNQNIAVSFKTPLGTNSISPNPAWSQQLTVSTQQFNIRIADVTNIVSAADVGQYSIEGIPSGSNYTGWTLAVVWKNNTLPPRFISIDTYDDLVGTTLSLNVNGFITPPTGNIDGRSAMVVGSAESWTSSGPTSFGPTTAGLVNLVGPNNPVANFFQMQVNDSNSESANVGLLDTSGTFGSLNSGLNLAGPPAANVRYHWDMTNVSISAGLTNSQSQGVFRFGPVNNAYVVHLLSLQIEAQSPIFDTTKFVDKDITSVGNTLTYTAVITNTGNFASNNLVFIDTIPTGTTFKPSSVIVDGVPNLTASPLPPTGFDIGPIAEGQTVTVTFDVNVTGAAYTTINNVFGTTFNYTPAVGLTLTGGTTSNIASTFIFGVPSIPNSKSVSKSFANVGDILTYTINLRNSGTATAVGVVLIDTIPAGTTFQTNSLTLNGALQTGADPIPPTGFNVGDIGINSPATITFQVKVDSTIPTPNPVQNQGIINYTYTTTIPDGGSVALGSNIVNTQINTASISGIAKFVDKNFATCKDILNYTIVVPNSGNITAFNVIIKDTIPNGTILVSNSVFVDNVNVPGGNPMLGVTIPSIGPATTSTLTFQVQVQC